MKRSDITEEQVTPLTAGELKRQLQRVPNDYVVRLEGCCCIDDARSAWVDHVTRRVMVTHRLELRP